MTEKERKTNFEKLDTLAKEKGISFYRIAKDLDFPTSMFSDWRSGKYIPKYDKLVKIARYLDVDVEYLLPEEAVV